MELVVLRYFQLVVYIAWSSKDLKRSKPKCKHLGSANCLECNVSAAQEHLVANIELQVHPVGGRKLLLPLLCGLQANLSSSNSFSMLPM